MRLLLVLFLGLTLAYHAYGDRGLSIASHVTYASEDNYGENDQRFIYPTEQYRVTRYGSFGSMYIIPTSSSTFAGRTFFSTPYTVAYTSSIASSTPVTTVWADYDRAANSSLVLDLPGNIGYVASQEGSRIGYFSLSDGSQERDSVKTGDASWVALKIQDSTGMLWAVGNSGPSQTWFFWYSRGGGNKATRKMDGIQTNCYSIFMTSTNAYLGCNGAIVVNPLSNNAATGTFSPTEVKAYPLGAGQYASGVLDDTNNILYLGSSIGLGMEVHLLPVPTLGRIFFLSSTVGFSSLRSVYLDTRPRGNVLFWSTSDGQVARVNTRDFAVYATATMPGVDLKALTYTDENLYYGAGYTTAVNNYRTYVATKTSCTEYTSCEQCQTNDLEYCGICLNSGACTSRRDCEAASVWEQGGFCPVGTALSISRGNVAGGTVVTYQGNYFRNNETADYRCKWTQGTNAPMLRSPVEMTGTTVVCDTPTGFTVGAASLAIQYRTREWSNPLTFTFYDCAEVSTCSDCSTPLYSECGWCFPTAKCSAPSSCAAQGTLEWQQSTCPLTTQATPAAVSTAGGETISIKVQNLPSATPDYFCQIGSFERKAATVVAGEAVTELTCPSPTQPSLTVSNATYSINVVNSVGLSLTTSTASIEVYNCSAFTRCYECSATGRPVCRWNDVERTCGFAATGAAPVVANCPSLSSINPSSVEADFSADVPISITGTGLTVGIVNCLWMLGSTESNVTSGIVHNATYATCNTPGVIMTAGSWILGLGVGSTVETNTLELLSYTCASEDRCDSCLDPRRTACRWCRAPNGLGCTSGANPSCPSTANIGIATECPIISVVNPDSLILGGGEILELNGTYHIMPTDSLADLQCVIYDPSTTTKHVLAISWSTEDERVLLCNDTPTLTTPTVTELYIEGISNEKYFSNVVALPFVDCGTFTYCSTCLEASSFCNWCGSSCNVTCPVFPIDRGCPIVSKAEPSHASIEGGDQIAIHGSNFLYFAAKRATPFSCDWGGYTTVASSVSPSQIQCTTPALFGAANVTLTVLIDGVPYLDPINIEFFSCPVLIGVDACLDACVGNRFCGWCVDSTVCGSQARCTSAWQPTCVSAQLEPKVAPIEGGTNLTATLDYPFPSSIRNIDLNCSFGPLVTAASFSTAANVTSVVCVIPPFQEARSTDFQLLYLGNKYLVPTDFVYTQCGKVTDCTTCLATPYCGWCSKGNECTMESVCKGKWNNQKCPINKVAVGVGVGLGLLFLICLVILLLFLIRRARRRAGLVIALKEPNYAEIAWGNDVVPAWRVPDHNYKILETALARCDFILQLAIAFNCPPTEQDALAKALVYIAASHDLAAEMIQTCIRAEVQACKQENTLFRNNSVASKMYKFYSRIVGIKYLFNCIARVILELEVLGRQQQSAMENPGNNKETSLLSVSMELDQTKALEDDMDTDTNLLQLQLICQKLLNVLIKTSLKDIPPPFRKIFVEIDTSVMAKFAGSNDAVYKGIGGLFFLRFVCPAITAPHVYGLLETPPNSVTQRQLVLISKVIQSIANMQAPGKKEQYMAALGDFINSAIPRIIKFYDNLRQAVNVPGAVTRSESNLEVPEVVRQNSLAATWNFLWNEKDKIKKWADTDDSCLDHTQRMDIVAVIDDCVEQYPSAPKKIKNEAQPGSSGGTKKKTKQ